MVRMTSLILEDRAGQWPISVDWIASLRPVRFDHEGRTFDAAGQQADGTWIYRTAQDPPPGPKTVPVRLERGEARCFVAEIAVLVPLPKKVKHDGVTYTRRGDGSDGKPQYWHG